MKRLSTVWRKEGKRLVHISPEAEASDKSVKAEAEEENSLKRKLFMTIASSVRGGEGIRGYQAQLGGTKDQSLRVGMVRTTTGVDRMWEGDVEKRLQAIETPWGGNTDRGDMDVREHGGRKDNRPNMVELRRSFSKLSAKDRAGIMDSFDNMDFW